MNSKTVWVVLLILIVGGAAWYFMVGPGAVDRTVAPSGEESGMGEQSGPSTRSELEARVVIASPLSGASVEKNFTVVGVAPGPWYFEASFPIDVLDASGAIVAQGYAEAQDEWMTPNDVAFMGNVSVKEYTGPATLVLRRDNASGLPEHDASVSLPIIIK